MDRVNGAQTTGEVAERLAQNEVRLTGRVSAPAEERELPSGDVIATWRLVVDRPADRSAMRRAVGRDGVPTRPRAVVDTFDCVVRTARLRRSVRGFAAGDVVAVDGALRRRFFRGGSGGPASRYEVEVAAVRRLARQASR